MIKQTRHAITFLQAQYRALLQHALWSRFASMFSRSALLSLPVLSSVAIAATSSGYSYTTYDYGLGYELKGSYGEELYFSGKKFTGELSLDTGYSEDISPLTVHTGLSAAEIQALEDTYKSISYEQNKGALTQSTTITQVSELDAEPELMHAVLPQSVDVAAEAHAAEAVQSTIPESELNPASDASDQQSQASESDVLAALSALRGVFAPQASALALLPVHSGLGALESLSQSAINIAAVPERTAGAMPFELQKVELGAFAAPLKTWQGPWAMLPHPRADQKPLHLNQTLTSAPSAEGSTAVTLVPWSLQSVDDRALGSISAANRGSYGYSLTELNRPLGAVSAVQVESEPAASSVFAAPAPLYLARTTPQGELQVQAADGTQLSFDYLDADAPLEAKLGVITPQAQQGEEGAVSSAFVPSAGYAYGDDAWLQVSLDEGTSYEIVLDSDEDYYELLSSLESGQSFARPDLVFDVSALGEAEHPSTLKIDGSFFEPESARAPYELATVQGEVLVRNANVATTSTSSTAAWQTSQRPMAQGYGPAGTQVPPVLDLEQVQYEQEDNGQINMNLALEFSDQNSLVLKDKLTAREPKSNLLGLYPYATNSSISDLKLGRSSVFAPEPNTSLRDQELTLKLNVAPKDNQDHSTLRTPSLGSNTSQLELTFSAGGKHAANSNSSELASSIGAENESTAVRHPLVREQVSFIVDPHTALEVDVSDLSESSLAIAAGHIKDGAQDASAGHELAANTRALQPSVQVERDKETQLLRFEGVQLVAPQVAESGDTAAAAAETETAPASSSVEVPVVAMLPQEDSHELKLKFAPLQLATLKNAHDKVHQETAGAGAAPAEIPAAVTSEESAPESLQLAGSFDSLKLPHDFKWVEIPTAQTLQLNGGKLPAPQDTTDADDQSGTDTSGVEHHKFLVSPEHDVVEVRLKPESELHLVGSGHIGKLTGAGSVALQDAWVQVEDAKGELSDVKVKSVTLDNSTLKLRDLGAEHLNFKDSVLEAHSLKVFDFAKDEASAAGNAEASASGDMAAALSAAGAEPSFKAVNSELNVQFMDLGSAQAEIQGGILQSQELHAHQLHLSDGVSAFVQNIELKGLDSKLVLGAGECGSSSTSEGEAPVAKAKAALKPAAAAKRAEIVGQKSAVGASEKESKLKSRALPPLSALQSSSLELKIPNLADLGAQDPSALAEKPYGFGALWQWREGERKHTTLISESINLNGGLLQLYGSPYESVMLFTSSLEGKNDTTSMELSGDVIIGRNSALGIGPDYKSFVAAYGQYQERQKQEADALYQKLKQQSGKSNNERAYSLLGSSPYAIMQESRESLDAAGGSSAGAYLYVDRSGINLGEHKIIMGTEDLNVLQSMLQSPYSIYMGLGSTMQISARALYGVDNDPTQTVFSDMDGKIVASRHGRLIVPVSSSQDIARVFGSGVFLRDGDVLHVSTENGLFSGEITSTDQLRGKKRFNFNMVGDPREVLSELSAPTFEQSLRIMSTAVRTYDSIEAFGVVPDSQLDEQLDSSTLNDLSSVNSAGISNVLNSANVVLEPNVTDTTTGTTTTTTTGDLSSSVSNALGSSNSITASVDNTLESAGDSVSATVSDSLNTVAVSDTPLASEGADATLSADSAGAVSGSGSSGGSGGSDDSGSSSGPTVNVVAAAQSDAAAGASDTGIKLDKSSYGYSFLMDALGAHNSEAIEQVTRMATLGGSLHSVYLVNGTASEAMHSRLGVGVNAALAVNSERKGNITISENGAGSALWMTPMYRSFNADDLSAQGREYGTDLELFGVVMGLEMSPAKSWRVGVMWNVGAGNAEGKDVSYGIDNDFDFYGLGLYAGVDVTSRLSLSADVSYSVVDNELSAATYLVNWGEMHSEVDSTALSMGVGAQYTVEARQMELSPHVGLRYNRLALDDYSVTIDGHKVASSTSDDMNIISIPMGITLAREFSFASWVLRPAFDFTFTTNLGDTSMDSTTRFEGITGADFEYTTDILDRFTYGATVGVSASSDQLSFGLNVGYTGSAHTSDVMGSAQLRYMF